MTLIDFIIEATKHGEFEIGPNVQFDKHREKFYGFSWITGPVFSNSVESLLDEMMRIAKKQNYKPQRKIFILDKIRDEKERFK